MYGLPGKKRKRDDEEPQKHATMKKQKNNQGAPTDAQKKTTAGDKTAKAKAKKDIEKVPAVDDNAR